MACTLRAVVTEPSTPPTRDHLAATIRALVSERIAPRSGWTDDTALADLGLDSMELMELGMSVEDDLGIRNWSLDPAANPEAFVTVNAMVAFVAGRIAK